MTQLFATSFYVDHGEVKHHTQQATTSILLTAARSVVLDIPDHEIRPASLVTPGTLGLLLLGLGSGIQLFASNWC